MSTLLSLLKPESTLAVLALPDLRNKFELSFFELLLKGSRVVGHLSGSKSDLRELIDFTIKTGAYPDTKQMKFG